MKIENQNRDHCCFIPSRFPCKINLQLIPNSRFPDLALMNFLIFFRFVERSSFFKSQSHQDWNCCFRQLSPVTGMFNVHRVKVSCKSQLHQWDTNIYPTDQKTIKSEQSKDLFLQVLPVCWKLPQTRKFGDNVQILASISSKMLYFQFMLDGICRNFSNLNGSMEACGIIYAKFDHFHSPWGGWGHKAGGETWGLLTAHCAHWRASHLASGGSGGALLLSVAHPSHLDTPDNINWSTTTRSHLETPDHKWIQIVLWSPRTKTDQSPTSMALTIGAQTQSMVREWVVEVPICRISSKHSLGHNYREAIKNWM